MSLRPPPPQAIVLFGASGDLTRRKLVPALYNLCRSRLLPERLAVVGYARTPMSNGEFREQLRASVTEHSRTGLDEQAWSEFARNVVYLAGTFEAPGSMDHLRARLEELDRTNGTEGRRLFYCATPPSAYPDIARRLGEAGLAEGSCIVVEKPFGYDLTSAQELNRVLHEVFDERQIFRIDHYLGKETVQNILVFRFSNGMFEPIWNRRYVSRVEIDVAEDIGIEGRGRFYQDAGAVRDIVQNHMLQLLAFLALEPPAAFEPESIRNEKVKLLRSVPPVDPGKVVRGQYTTGEIGGRRVPGYREEPHVPPDSITETFVAMRLAIDNWRWAGVPFFLRTGKRLAERNTQVAIFFHDAPTMLFEQSGLGSPDPNHITIRIQPNEGISLAFDAKLPGPEMRTAMVFMDFDYEESFMTKPAEAYEHLIHDAMDGDRTLFMRGDEIERSWEIVDPILKPVPPEPYAAGSWGPAGADELIAPARWHLR